MSSPDRAISLDDLFRKALAPTAAQQPTKDVWARVVAAIRCAPASGQHAGAQGAATQAASDADPGSARGLPAGVEDVGQRLQRALSLSPYGLIHTGPHCGCRPSPFIGAMATQILDRGSRRSRATTRAALSRWQTANRAGHCLRQGVCVRRVPMPHR